MVRVSVKHMMFRLKEKGKWFHRCFSRAWQKPTNVTSNHIDILVSFVLQLYVWKHDTLGAARLDKFEKSTDDDLRLLPLSKDAPRQHIYCASYQAECLWRHSVEELDILDPEQWGWNTNFKGEIQPLWSTSQSSVTVKNFIETSSCKTGKSKSCKCPRAHVACLYLCECGRGCIRIYVTVVLNFCFCR